MRAILIFGAIAAFITLLFKWRHRIVNTLLVISALKKMMDILDLGMIDTMKKCIHMLPGCKMK